uniref:tRNA-specific adenosine deaminase n=1 Tax=uncultured bacterium Contigcl_1774 TaxID=1393661 RepID=W0FT65_9BACT|nr:tRNA-adenosine deaminase [uncultured bacterium Contigcl_1774]
MESFDPSAMRTALEEAEKALREGEVPVGAALFLGEKLLWADHNRREALNDPTAHAEMLCLRNGAAALGDWRLKDCTLYVTLEPCPMCSGALLMSRLGRCVFGAADPDAGCCGSVYDLPADPLLCGSTVWEHGVLEADCRALLNRFFSRKRQKGGSE